MPERRHRRWPPRRDLKGRPMRRPLSGVPAGHGRPTTGTRPAEAASATRTKAATVADTAMARIMAGALGGLPGGRGRAGRCPHSSIASGRSSRQSRPGPTGVGRPRRRAEVTIKCPDRPADAIRMEADSAQRGIGTGRRAAPFQIPLRALLQELPGAVPVHRVRVPPAGPGRASHLRGRVAPGLSRLDRSGTNVLHRGHPDAAGFEGHR